MKMWDTTIMVIPLIWNICNETLRYALKAFQRSRDLE
jgi:hypothetical protein